MFFDLNKVNTGAQLERLADFSRFESKGYVFNFFGHLSLFKVPYTAALSRALRPANTGPPACRITSPASSSSLRCLPHLLKRRFLPAICCLERVRRRRRAVLDAVGADERDVAEAGLRRPP